MNMILNFAPTGMIPTKDMTPHVPISASEIVEQVHEAVELGITMVHLHARDDLNGQATYQPDIYRKLSKASEASPGNIELIKRIHKIAAAVEKNIMPPSELRTLLHLEPGNGRYGRKSKRSI